MIIIEELHILYLLAMIINCIMKCELLCKHNNSLFAM